MPHALLTAFSFVYLIYPIVYGKGGIPHLILITLYAFFTYDYLRNRDSLRIRLTMFDIVVCCSVVFGGVMTFLVAEYVGSILSAGIVGLLGYLISKINHKLFELQFSTFCGAFVGMTSSLLADNLFLITVSSLVASIMYILLRNSFVGIGGKLGAVAFSGVISVLSGRGVIDGIF